MNEFKLSCSKCGAEYTADEIESGEIPACEKCQGRLEIAGKVKLVCIHCSLEGIPDSLPSDEALICEKCSKPLLIISTEREIPPSSKDNETTSTEENPVTGTSGKSTGGGYTLAVGPSTVVMKNPSVSKDAPAEPKGGILKKTFGKFEVIREIARGGMGIVYKVHDPDLRRDLALKVLLQGEGANENAIKRFMREARAAGNLNHPNIVPVHEMGQIEGQYFFTMDFIEGHSLQDFMENKGVRKMRQHELIEKIRDVCLALQAAHDKGIIHRDLKPANIMIRDNDQQVILMDFGLAKECTNSSIVSMTGVVVGSPAYMSPEQAKGKVHGIDHRSDIYSIGILLYEGLTGIQPFCGETVFDTLTKVVHQEPVPPRNITSGIPVDLQNIVLKCMEKDPLKRYNSSLELAADLDAYLSGDKVSAKSIMFIVRFWRKIRRKPLALAGVIAVPLIIAAIIAAWFMFTRPSYVDIATQSMKSTNPDRRMTVLKELSALLSEQKIKNNEERNRALQLIRDRITQSEKPDIVDRAAKSAAQFLDEKALPNLVQLAKSNATPEAVRLTILESTATIAEKKNFPGINVPAILTSLALNEKIPLKIRLKAAEGLKKAWGFDQLFAIIDLAKNTQAFSELRVMALRALSGRIPFESPRMSDIIQLYADPDQKVAAAAAECLKSSRTADSLFDFYGIKGVVAKAVSKAGEVVKLNADHQKELMDMMNDEVKTEKKEITPLEAMISKLNGNDPERRLAAAYDLGQLGDGKAVPELVKHLTDSDSRIRGVAARSIVQLSPTVRPNMEEIRKLLGNEDMLVREQASFIIGELKDSDSLAVLIKSAEQEQSRRVAVSMANTFKQIGNPTCLPSLSRMLERFQDNDETAIACVKSMASFNKQAIRQLTNVLDSKNVKVQKAALEELKEICGVDFGTDKSRWEQWEKR
jgi:serine/threonine protein kinase/DNA-directed RNA polymerase subunit RPC12/RpoP